MFSHIQMYFFGSLLNGAPVSENWEQVAEGTGIRVSFITNQVTFPRMYKEWIHLKCLKREIWVV